MKLNEFKEQLNNSAKFNINNRSNQIDASSYIQTGYKRKPKALISYLAMMASFLLIIAIGGFVNLRNDVVNILTIDINPSLEVELNAFNQVVNIKGYSDEADIFIDNLDVNFDKLDTFLEKVYSEGLASGYFTENNASAIIGVYSNSSENDNKIFDYITEFQSITLYTIYIDTQDTNLNTINIGNENFIDSDFVEIPEGGYDQDSLPLVEDPANDNVVREMTESEVESYFDSLDISKTKLDIIITVYNAYGYTNFSDLETLVALSNTELMNMYNNLN